MQAGVFEQKVGGLDAYEQVDGYGDIDHPDTRPTAFSLLALSLLETLNELLDTYVSNAAQRESEGDYPG